MNGDAMTLTDEQRVEVARDNGIRIPDLAIKVAREENVAYWVLCAFLVQETSGGNNVFGSDPTQFRGIDLDETDKGRLVTKDRYQCYKAQRGRMGAQGVGPMQLTAKVFQDAADELGGCWDPEANLRVGCRWIRDRCKQGMSWHDIARDYNGSGPQAEAYADEMDERFAFWRQLMIDEENP